MVRLLETRKEVIEHGYGDMLDKKPSEYIKVSTRGKTAEQIIDELNLQMKTLPKEVRYFEVLDANVKEVKCATKSKPNRTQSCWYITFLNLLTCEIKEMKINHFMPCTNIIPLRKPKKKSICNCNDTPKIKADKIREECKNNPKINFYLDDSVKEINGNTDKVLFVCKEHGNKMKIRVGKVTNSFQSCTCWDMYVELEKQKENNEELNGLVLIEDQQWTDIYTKMKWKDKDEYEFVDYWSNVVNRKNCLSPNNPEYGNLKFERDFKEVIKELGLEKYCSYQQTCVHLKDEKQLRYDALLRDKNGKSLLIIETDGDQHYQYTPHFHRKGIEDYYNQVYRDWLKEELSNGKLWIGKQCFKGIKKTPMLIIHYKDRDKKRIKEILLNDPIIQKLIKENNTVGV